MKAFENIDGNSLLGALWATVYSARGLWARRRQLLPHSYPHLVRGKVPNILRKPNNTVSLLVW